MLATDAPSTHGTQATISPHVVRGSVVLPIGDPQTIPALCQIAVHLPMQTPEGPIIQRDHSGEDQEPAGSIEVLVAFVQQLAYGRKYALW